MKTIIAVIILTFVSLQCLSMVITSDTTKRKIIHIDTINLRGYIYDSRGKAVRYIGIQSTQKSFNASNYNLNIGTRTDTNGYFELKGIKPFDTLITRKTTEYKSITAYNKGSRYMVIYLPDETVNDISANNNIIIQAPRRYPKKIPAIKVEDFNGCILFTEVHLPPQFMGGYQQFISLLQQKLKYPQKAIDNNVEGAVMVSFKVERDGTMTGFKIIRGLGYGCDDALIAAIRQLPKWRPAIDDGRATVTTETITVEFKLTDK